jgi:hypothetical protein
MNYEKYGRSTASAQYFLQLAGYLGIPVIAWNADNSGLERVSREHLLYTFVVIIYAYPSLKYTYVPSISAQPLTVVKFPTVLMTLVAFTAVRSLRM